MQVSINWLSESFEMHGATVRKRIIGLDRDKKGKVNLRAAAEAIFGMKIGNNGEFIGTPEAVRQLTVAKKQEIDLDMEIKRGDRVPIADCLAVDNEVFQSIVGTIKAHRGKVLNETVTNEMFETLRDWAGRMNGNH